MRGRGGDDVVLLGSGGSDTLIGGDGDDVLHRQGGANAMTGGAGADLFAIVNRTPMDTSTDFTIGEDLIQAVAGRGYAVEASEGGVVVS